MQGGAKRAAAVVLLAMLAAVLGLSLTATGAKRVAKDMSRCMGLKPTRSGTARSETVRGTPGRDVIQAGAGNDRVLGLGGNDVICGGFGNDTISGGMGND